MMRAAFAIFEHTNVAQATLSSNFASFVVMNFRITP